MAFREDAEQAAFFQWVNLVPRIRDHVFAIPNGAFMGGNKTEEGRRRGGMMLRLGLRPGVPDIFLPIPVLHRPLEAGEACGLFIEMKAPAVAKVCSPFNPKLVLRRRLQAGTTSAEQRAFIELLEREGYRARCAKGFDEARELVNLYLRGELR